MFLITDPYISSITWKIVIQIDKGIIWHFHWIVSTSIQSLSFPGRCCFWLFGIQFHWFLLLCPFFTKRVLHHADIRWYRLKSVHDESWGIGKDGKMKESILIVNDQLFIDKLKYQDLPYLVN